MKIHTRWMEQKTLVEQLPPKSVAQIKSVSAVIQTAIRSQGNCSYAEDKWSVQSWRKWIYKHQNKTKQNKKPKVKIKQTKDLLPPVQFFSFWHRSIPMKWKCSRTFRTIICTVLTWWRANWRPLDTGLYWKAGFSRYAYSNDVKLYKYLYTTCFDSIVLAFVIEVCSNKFYGSSSLKTKIFWQS